VSRANGGAFQRLRARLGIFDLHERIDGLERELQALRERDDEHSRIQAVWAATEWVARAAPSSDTLVSVVLATRDRCTLLPSAIDSVVAQTHCRWELLVVDDASTDGTAEYLAAHTDSRIRTVTGTGAGLPAARNAGLEAATGSVVTYLDDDNRMAPHWLRGVAWAFDRDAALALAYGAAIVDDLERVSGRAGGGMPAALHVPYSRGRAVAGPMVDIGVMAHRADLPGARFDERFPIHGDWDLFLRLSRDRDPLALPVLASFYATSAPGRLQDRPEHTAELDAIAAEHRA
jgi:glycosyltransferase involved in cell wall biosynthesis